MPKVTLFPAPGKKKAASSALATTLTQMRAARRPGLMTHLVAGYPNLRASLVLARTLIAGGADLLEVQIPFSDPIADGTLLAAANQRALQNGFQVKDVFWLVQQLRNTVPIFLMGYCNTIFKSGIPKFCARAARAGVAGLIFPDLPFDEKENSQLQKACQQFGLVLIPVVSELTSDQRLSKIAQTAAGFIYCVARLGTTGLGSQLSRDLQKFLRRVRRFTALPLAVGFGIASYQDVRLALSGSAEIAVVGSALLKIWDLPKLTEDQKLKRIQGFVKKLKNP